MRTTVNIDDELLEALKVKARDEDLPFTQVLNRALRAGVQALDQPPARRPRHREQTFAMGEPRFDLDRALALAAALEDQETVRKLPAPEVKLVDLNVLLYAVNKDAVHHRAALEWWEQALRGEEPVALAWHVLLGFLRLSSNPDVFPRPLDERTALGKIDAWLAHPNTRVLREKDEHWEVLRLLIEEAGTAGNLTTDSHLAALAISHGAVLVSFDSDFGRFKGLRWSRPDSSSE